MIQLGSALIYPGEANNDNETKVSYFRSMLLVDFSKKVVILFSNALVNLIWIYPAK